MRLGVREICEVVLKAKGTQRVGNKTFFKNEPVIYFDSLKTSTLEGAATTVYATGGRGNARLIAWEGERTITFTMEDALISPISFSILSGAGLIEASKNELIHVHTTEYTDVVKKDDNGVTVRVAERPYVGNIAIPEGEDYEEAVAAAYAAGLSARDGDEHYIYVMVLKEGEVVTEPYIPNSVKTTTDEEGNIAYELTILPTFTGDAKGESNDLSEFATGGVVLVDYYIEKTSGACQIDISPDQFGGNYYLEASTLFRDQTTGQDLPAEFIIPNCKIQSNFTFTMASSGDPSTFTFTMDAFPDYTRFNKTKKVLAAMQIIEPEKAGTNDLRDQTYFGYRGTTVED